MEKALVSIGKKEIQEMIDEVARVTGCDYMKQSKIPPHVTVSALVSDNEAALLAEMESIAETMNKGSVFFYRYRNRANENPAFMPFKILFDDVNLQKNKQDCPNEYAFFC